MADPLIADVSGLQISNNTFSASPPGSLLVARNIVIPQKGVAEPRRGQNRAYRTPSASEIAFAMTEFRGLLVLSSAASKLSTSYTLGFAGNPTVEFSGGPYNPVDNDGSSIAYGRMKFGFGGSYLYFCTTTGPKALETTSSQPRAAGLLPMPDCFARMLSASAGVGWLSYGSSAAYRTLLRRPTSDGVSLLSPPSGRSIVTNRLVAESGSMVRSGSALVTVTFPGSINPGLSVSDTFDLTPGEANFPAGTYTVFAITGNVMIYSDAGLNVSNTDAQDFDTGPRPVAIAVNLSEDATTSTPARIYRSLATSSSTTEPSDELFLIAEVQPDATAITNGSFSYDDFTPEFVLSDQLYTNPQTGDGATQANFAPPLYRDLAYWGDRMWYANTTGAQTMRLQMLGVGSPDGIQNNDTITVALPDLADSVTITFKNTPAGTGDSFIVSNGAPSYNIQQTAQFFARALSFAMNASDLPVRAYYASAQDEAPGRLLLQRIDNIDEPFRVTVSRPETWVPALSVAAPIDSVAERVPNGLNYSKLGQSESVPAVNFTAVGSKNYAIARILGLQQALLVFKEGDGIYSVTGQAPFQVQQISTANIIAPDCCALFADAAWVYTDQGILRVSDSGGATVVSRAIETELNELRAMHLAETYAYGFAVPYEVERRIMFFVPFDTDESGRPELMAWAYNNATQSWSGPLYESNVFSGVVSPSLAQLYLGEYDYSSSTGRATLERKTQTVLDYADANTTHTISAVNVGGNPLIIQLSSVADVSAGDGVTQSTFATKIRSLRPDLGGGCIEIYESIPWSVSSCSIYRHYDVEVQFQPAGSPTTRKTLTRLTWLFKPGWFSNLAGNSLVMTDQIQANEEISTPFAGFGLTPFGQGPFGNPTPLAVDVNPIGPLWTNASQFFPGFELSEAWCKFRLQGFSPLLESAIAPVGRGR